MTGRSDGTPRRPALGPLVGMLIGVAGLMLGDGAVAAEAPYPFEGSWVRAERTCTASTVRLRTYTAKDVVSPLGRCAIRRIASGSGAFELLEECRRNDRPMTVTETLRLTSPDAMTLKRQLSRLKIPRQLHYVRCSIAPTAAHPPRPAPAPGSSESKTR